MTTRLRYVVGDATRPQGDGPKLLIHVVNDAGAWGKGFVLAVSKRWKAPEKAYRAWSNGLCFVLGESQVVDVAEDLAVVNMLAQEGYRGPGPHIRYRALQACLKSVAKVAEQRGATIHCPRIGCGLAGGVWSEVEKLLEKELRGLDVTVYDLPQTKKPARRARR